MIKSAAEILLEKGIDLEKIRKEKKESQQKACMKLVQFVTEWLEKHEPGTTIALIWSSGSDHYVNKRGFRYKYEKYAKNPDGYDDEDEPDGCHTIRYDPKIVGYHATSILESLGFVITHVGYTKVSLPTE